MVLLLLLGSLLYPQSPAVARSEPNGIFVIIRMPPFFLALPQPLAFLSGSLGLSDALVLSELA